MLRLLTYNVHGCIGRTGREAPDPVMEVLRNCDADVVALQEVFDNPDANHNLMRGLESLGYRAVVHGVTMDTPRGAYGNVLMSRVKPSTIHHIDLGGIEPRGAIRFHLDLPDGPVDVCATHLGLGAAERLRQLRQIDGVLFAADHRHDDALQVLMGDLNEWRPSTRLIRTLRKRFPWVSRLASFPARWPILPLDRIAVRGRISSVRFQRWDQPPAQHASDHRPLVADITVAPARDARH